MTRKYFVNALLIAVTLVVLFVPDAKALIIRGLMHVGLFQPKVETKIHSGLLETGDIKFKDADGRIVSLAQFEGKVVFINLWATWCPPCVAEMPSINKLYQRYRSDINVEFLMVDVDGELKKSKSFFSKKGYQMPLYQMYSKLPTSLFSGSVPTTMVFDKRGRLSFREEGSANYASAKFIKFIEQLKAQKN